MSSVRFMLADFRDWTALRSQELDHFIAAYPYSHYAHTDTVNILRFKIQDIVSQITAHLSHNPPPGSPQNIHPTEEPPFTHLAYILCKVKVTLENIRFSFLAIDAIKTLSSTRILNKIQECIDLLETRPQGQHFDGREYYPRNRSQRSVDYAGTAPVEVMHRFRQEMRKRQQDQAKKTSTSTYLYEDMSKYLNQKEKRSNRDRILSNRLYVTPSQKLQRYGYGKERQDFQKKIIHNSEPQKELICHKHKKRFRYLQQYEREITKQEGEQFSLRYQQLHRTPDSHHNYKSLPSTQERDISPPKEYQLEDELPEFDERAFDLQALKQQIDFGVNISKIKHREENEGWEQFEQDSIEKAADVDSNLQDSLEVMKQEEMLNKTGQFNAPVPLAKEPHQYSFGLE